MAGDEYILGTDRAELERLRTQHEVWHPYALPLWKRAGIGTGARVLDLGSGPGFTTRALADVVGPTGHVVGRDMSPRFLAHLDQAVARDGLANISTSLGSAETHDPALGAFDFVYTRWLFCWLANPGAAIAETARYLAPGGRLVLQEYIHWGSMSLFPHSAPFDRAVQAFMAHWAAGGGDINVGRRYPEIARTHGLRIAWFQPVARLGAVGSPEWRWIGAFMQAFLPKLVPLGLITEAEVEARQRDWDARTARGDSYCYTPVMSDVILEPTTG